MKVLRVKVTLMEEMLGMASADPKLHESYIASKAPDAPSIEEEVEALGVEQVIMRASTIYPRAEDGTPILWNYQLKGYFKDAVSMLRRVDGTKCAKVKAYKKEIDGLMFVGPRQVKIKLPEGGAIGHCQRPLRAETLQGPRVAISNSETVPAGSTLEFTITLYRDDMADWVRECLNYGSIRGLGQWRNSGKGIFTWEELECVTKEADFSEVQK